NVPGTWPTVSRSARASRTGSAMPRCLVVDGLEIVAGVDLGLDHRRVIRDEGILHDAAQLHSGAGRDHGHTEVVAPSIHALLFSEVGPVEAEVTSNLLDLDQREPAVVEHDDGQGESEPTRDGDLTARHLEASVPDEGNHRAVRAGELCGDGGRQTEAHR